MLTSCRIRQRKLAGTWWLAAALVAAALAGCGGRVDNGTYQLKGRVTHDGQPVRYGTVLLSPDADKGNTGPGAAAGIVDGQFRTESGKGHVGGDYVLQITGYDGVPVQGGEGLDTMGSALFPPYEVQVQLPQADAEYDIDVPASVGRTSARSRTPSPINSSSQS